MAARTNTRLSQGGQPAGLGPGLQLSTWYLAAFAGFRSSHNIIMACPICEQQCCTPKPALVYTAKSRDLNSDLCMSVHHEASMPHCHTRVDQNALFTDI